MNKSEPLQEALFQLKQGNWKFAKKLMDVMNLWDKHLVWDEKNDRIITTYFNNESRKESFYNPESDNPFIKFMKTRRLPQGKMIEAKKLEPNISIK